jgi:hypothetical protein
MMSDVVLTHVYPLHTMTHTHTKRIQSPWRLPRLSTRTSPPILSMHHPCMLSFSLKSHGSCCVPVCVHEEPQDKARALATSFCKAAMTSTSIRSHRSRSQTPCCHSHASRSSRHDMVTCTHACIRPPTAWAGVDAEKRKENVWAPCCTLWVAMLEEFFFGTVDCSFTDD